jgi:hypothetical protein
MSDPIQRANDHAADCARASRENARIQAEKVFAAMWERVNLLPDTGEGCAWHLASERAWEIADDYRRASEGDASMLADWDTGYTFERIMSACLRDAARLESSASTGDLAYRQDEDEAWTIHRMAADVGSVDDACAVLDIMRSNGVDESTARRYLDDENALCAEEIAAQNASNHGLCADCGRSVATHVADDGEDTKVCRRCLLERWRYGFMHSADAGDTWSDWIADIDSRMIGSVV